MPSAISTVEVSLPAIPVAPSAEVWRAMSEDSKQRFLVTVYDALEQERLAMAELEAERRRATEAEARAAALEAEVAALRAKLGLR